MGTRRESTNAGSSVTDFLPSEVFFASAEEPLPGQGLEPGMQRGLAMLTHICFRKSNTWGFIPLAAMRRTFQIGELVPFFEEMASHGWEFPIEYVDMVDRSVVINDYGAEILRKFVGRIANEEKRRLGE